MVCTGISGDFSLQNTQSNQKVKNGKSDSLIKTLNEMNKNGFIEIIKDDHRPQDAIMNQDGSFTIITKWNDGQNARSREVTFVYDKNNNKIIKSVKNTTAELYGIKSTTKELIDNDGDGYADEAVITETEGEEVTTTKKKYPKVNEKTDKHELAHQGRDMHMVAKGLVCYDKKI